jgi:hypothetical protein
MSSSASDFKETIRIVFVRGGTKIKVPGIGSNFSVSEVSPIT